MVYFSGKIFDITLLFPNLGIKFSVAEIVERIFYNEISFLKITIFKDFLFITKIANRRVVENIFFEHLSHDL